MKLLLLLLSLTLPVLVRAQLLIATNYTYTTNNGTITTNGAITITRYLGGGAVVIPSTTNGYPVTTIGSHAFLRDSGVTSVTIPDSVVDIGTNAFAFCSGVSNLTIGNSVSSIGENAFEYCSSLGSVTIPSSLSNIEDGAFYRCTSLTNFTVGVTNSCYSSVNGVLFDKHQTTLIQFPTGGNGTTSYAIPDSVTNIQHNAFAYCINLTSVIIPNSVSRIGEQAFMFCYGLTTVTLSTNLTSIAVSTFASCISLTNVTIPDSVASIGPSAFGYCRSLPGISIPAGVTNIGSAAFQSCFDLTAITVDSQNALYSGFNGVLFDKKQTTLLQYPSGLNGGYAIPSGVTTIGEAAFAFSPGLTGVAIPNTVTSIGYEAFDDCPLASVTIPNSVTNIGSYAFAVCGNLTQVYFDGNAPIPNDDSSVFADDANPTAYYLPGTTGWGPTFDNIPATLWNPQVQTSDGSFGVQANQFGFNIIGNSNLVVRVQACTNLANPVWISVATHTLTGGSSYFSDPQWTNFPSRFYELSFP